MREEAAFLEDVADAALVGRHVDSARGVEQHGVVEQDVSVVRPNKARDNVDHGRLSGGGAPEQRGDTGRALEGDVEVESAQCGLGVERQHYGRAAAPATPVMRRATRRPTALDASSATKAMAIDTRVKRSAAPEPFGVSM